MSATLPRLGAGIAAIDTHCHLDMDRYDGDRDAVIERARAAGVKTMVTIGAGGPFECNHAAVALAHAHDDIYATVGVHPHDAASVDEETFAAVARLAEDPRVVGIGETGLDFYYDNSPRQRQEEVMRRFVTMARERDLPLVVHVRDAYDLCAAILREERLGTAGGIIHCFSGDRAAARQFLDLGMHLSFSGIVTFKNAEELRQAAKITPADRLLIETDAPFLAPIPMRGKRNEPAFVLHTAALLAEVRGESLDDLVRSTATNAQRLYRLPAA